MPSESLKKILWISDTEGWAYENRFNAIRRSSNFDHIQILTSGLSDERNSQMIKEINADLIIAQNPRAHRFIDREDSKKMITLLSGQRALLDWTR